MKHLFLFIIISIFCFNSFSQQISWTKKALVCKDFIENKGQYDHLNYKTPHDIKYCTQIGDVEVFLTTNGITYVTQKAKDLSKREKRKIGRDFDKLDGGTENKEEFEREQRNRYYKSTPSFLNVKWLNSNLNCEIIAEQKVHNYYTYGGKINNNLKASAYKKITYKNIYNNIDLVFTIPTDSSGIKYSFVLHPNANINDIKFTYKEAEELTIKDEQLVVNSKMGIVNEHAPKSFVANSSQAISSKFKVQFNIISFELNSSLLVNGINTSNQAVVIDPWVTVPSALDNSKAFDVNYDNAGNVFVLGGLQKLQKYNNAGVLQWTYFLSSSEYTDFALDPVTSTSYMFDLYPSNIYKISPAGLQVVAAMNPGVSLETWRAEYDACQNQLVIGSGNSGGGTQAFVVDVNNLTNITPKNILSESGGCHDLNMITIDDNGAFVYFHTTKSVCGNAAVHDNELVRSPLPALVPVTYIQATGYTFNEVMYTQAYFTPPALGGTSHGFNGLKVKGCYLYGYDGTTVKIFNKTTGATITSFSSGGTQFASAGIDIDNCGNIYVGVGNNIKVYSSTYSLVSTIPANNTVYDLRLTNNNKLVVSGNGFVQQIDLTATLQAVNVIDVVNATSCSACNGSAKAEFLCNNVATSACISYLWSNGATTQTVGGLCPGIYTVSVNANACYPSPNTGTVEIFGGANTPTLVITNPTTTCNQTSVDITNPSVTAGSAGGTMFSYWINSTATATLASANSVTVSGVYYIKYEDATGCAVIKPVSVALSTISPVASFSVTDACVNTTLIVTNSSSISTGTITNYAWDFGANALPITTSTLQLPTNLSYSTAGIQTISLTVTSNSGCFVTTTHTVMIFAKPTANFTSSPVCVGLPTVYQDASIANTGVISTWVWDFTQDGTTDSNAQNPTNTFPAAATYSTKLTVTTDKGCSDSYTAQVTVGNSPTVSINASSTCVGFSNTFSLSITPTVTGVTTYTYYFGDGTTSNIPNPSHTYTNASTTNITIYSASVTVVSNGCVSASTNTVQVLPLPVARFTFTNTCINKPPIYFDGSASSDANGTISSYQWVFGDGTTENNLTGLASHVYNAYGLYNATLTVISSNSCQSSVSHTIEVYQKPTANFTLSGELGTILSPNMVFTNTSNNYSYYWWNFGDNSPIDSIHANPMHNYQVDEPQSYISSLVVKNNFGCIDTTYKLVEIGADFIFYIPNSFSPNGDGINDVFTGVGVGIQKYDMWVYERWGSMVYHTNNIKSGWEGKTVNNLQDAPQDVYTWKVELKDVFGKKHSYVGHVTLLR